MSNYKTMAQRIAEWQKKPILPYWPGSGTGAYKSRENKIIRFTRKGCANRPFYHITVTEQRGPPDSEVYEQVGTYDPLPNEHGEVLVAFNYERIMYWLGYGAKISKPVAQLLGVAGFLPIHPEMILRAWRRRAKTKLQLEQSANENNENDQS